jgi:hypothetical protein
MIIRFNYIVLLIFCSGFMQNSNSSPSGLVIGEYYASDENEYFFCSDGRIKLSLTENYFYTGKWTLKNDSVVIKLNYSFHKKGIGSPLPPPEGFIPNNYLERYSKYKTYKSNIDTTTVLIWSEIEQLLKEDNEYPYQIINNNLDCETVKFSSF